LSCLLSTYPHFIQYSERRDQQNKKSIPFSIIINSLASFRYIMRGRLITATFKGGPWDGMQFLVAEGKQFLVVKCLKNDPDEDANGEIEKHLYVVDAAYNNVFWHTPHTKEDLTNLALED
jgi:hypothetical protein